MTHQGLDDRPPPRPQSETLFAWRTPNRGRSGIRVTADDLMIGIVGGAVFVAWWPMIQWLHGPRPRPVTSLIAHVTGMLAGYAVVVLIGLMARAPALERGVGADVLARWHGRGGRIVLSLVLVHAWAAIASWAQSRRESAALATWHTLKLPYLMATTVGTVLLVIVGIASVRAARRRLSYEQWHMLHLLTYVAVALSFLHQLAGPDLAGHRWLQLLWALLYTNVFALAIRYRVLTPLRQAVRHRLRVAALTQEAPGVVSIEVRGEHLRELQAEAGQFFRWRFLTPDHWLTAYPFSLSASPNDERLRLTVKALGQGSTALQDIEPGTWVVAEGPYGALTSARRTRHHVLLIAGGVGITPMRALFESMPLAPGQDMLLLYRARAPEHLVFRQELDDIARRRGARVIYLVGEGHGDLSSAGLLRWVPDIAQRDVYLCGPPPMANAVRLSLQGAGVPPDAIHEERFSW